MRVERGRRYLVVCGHAPCSEIFSRRICDVVRAPRSFCSRACFASTLRTGRRIIEVLCDGCGVHFRRTKAAAVRRGRKRQFCSSACYELHIDRSALGRAGGCAPHEFAPGFTVARARLAGAATARVRSREDWVRFSKAGVAARMEKMTAKERSAASRRGNMLRRFGPDVVLGVRMGKGRQG